MFLQMTLEQNMHGRKFRQDCVGKGLAEVELEADSLGYAFIIT